MKINYPKLKGQEKLCGWNNPNKIILHHTECYGSVEKLNNIMREMGYTCIGYTFYIRRNGEIYQTRPVNVTGANCYNQNHCSIGIAFEGNFNKDTMPQAQFESGVWLIKKLLKENPQIKEVNGHKYYRNTDCPGNNFPLQKMQRAISQTTTISSSSLDGQLGIIMGDGVRVRSTPSTTTSNNILGKLYRGNRVKLFKKADNNMLEIYYGKSGGFISSDYVKY